MENEIAITDAADADRYEARDATGNLMGFVDYQRSGEVIAFRHAETLPEFRGQGVAGRIAAKSLDDARAAGLRVRPACPYYQQFIEKHPEYADLVDEPK
ncbi:GNAT family N-acetyltransferase [Kribbella sp. CA-293567]|uniref:GNAT family N-acetyltransferase n=1 Tax=Kribbella sp. CA-293567 TaxID=3002436 RepID=UPI0022DD21CF|nr:GNAT family N-acetyltransferase [Kribbella sp. CA-293567]WBQ02190.1 GNAT family N-acetyltransferase [Kribbella sp. CA-293567]